MSELSKENKLRILARNFYADNLDQYDDYRHALTEFMANQPSDKFIEFALAGYLAPEDGHTILFRAEDGHVAAVRNADGFFSPRTEMSQDEGEKIEEQWEQALDEHPDLEGIELLEKLGWQRI